VLHFARTQLVQELPPPLVLLEVLGNTFGHQDVARVAAIHHALRDINADAGDVDLFVYIRDFLDRSAVNAHADAKLRMVF
jgi:hypothetical protein